MSMTPTTLQTVWFLLICVLWTGYVVLEGFDFGAGALLRHVARDRHERQAVLHSFGPVWDGNEVWLLTAGGATFAAFPGWYATLFSGFYLALFALLVALIVRNIGIEFWGKHDDDGWRRGWEWAVVVGSAVPALLVGVAWANIAHGVPIGADREYAGSFFTLLGPYALWGGVTSLTLFAAHGAHFLCLRTHGAVHERATRAAAVLAPAAAAVVAVFVIWTLLLQDGVEPLSAVFAGAAALAAAGAVWRSRAGREGWAFGLSALAIAGVFAMQFAWLFPNAMVDSDGAQTLSLVTAASGPYTLKVMTVVAVIFTPVVLLYQGWTYWVFRKRVGADDFRPAEPSA